MALRTPRAPEPTWLRSKLKDSFEFEVAYSENWKDIFDGAIEQMVQEIETTDIPTEVISDCGLSITDAIGARIVLMAAELEASGIPKNELFAASALGVAAHFPLRVRLGLNECSVELPLISPLKLLDMFLKNLLGKPLRFGGPVSMSHV